jgi:hypothetical protein
VASPPLPNRMLSRLNRLRFRRVATWHRHKLL